MTDDPTRDLSERSLPPHTEERRAIGRHHIRQVQAEPVPLAVPQAFNRWVIPGGVVLSAVTWFAAAGLDLRGDVEVLDLTVTMAALAISLALGLYVKEYLVHKASAHDHQLLLDETRLTREELMILKGQVLSLSGELKAILAGLSNKVDKNSETYWLGYGDGAADLLDHTTAVNATNVYPLSPRQKRT
jgi:hypothetical protein